MTADVRDVKKEIEDAIKRQIEKSGKVLEKFSAGWDEVKWELVDFHVDPIDPTKQDPESIMTDHWNNCSISADRKTWRDSATSTDTFTYSFHEGIEIGVEVSAEENLEIEKAGVKFSTKISLSATQTVTKTNSVTRSCDTEINVAACTRTDARVMLYRGKFESPLHVTVAASGPFSFVGKISGPDGAEIGYPAGLTIQDQLKSLGIENRFSANGTLGGTVGLTSYVETNDTKPSCPPDSLCNSKTPGSSAILSHKMIVQS